MLVAVVLPFVMRGIAMSAEGGAEVDRRASAMMLAQTMMQEAILAKAWESGDAEGTFDAAVYGDGAERFTWSLTSEDWGGSGFYNQLTLTVSWGRGDRMESVQLQTVVNI